MAYRTELKHAPLLVNGPELGKLPLTRFRNLRQELAKYIMYHPADWETPEQG